MSFVTLPRGPLLSPEPGTPILTGAVYNSVAPAPQDRQGCTLQCDSQGNLLVNVAVGGGGGSGSNVNLVQVGGAPIALGQALAAASLPVVLTAAQIATLTPLSTVAVSAITSPLPAGTNVIGHVITDTGSTTTVTGNVIVVQPTGTNLHVVVDSGSFSATGSLTNNNAAPAANNMGVLPAIANASPPAYTEGNQVLLSTDLSGVLRVGITNSPTVTVVQPTAANLNAQVQGMAAADATAVGNPVLVGGVDAAGNIQELPVADAGSTAPTQTLLIGGRGLNVDTNIHPIATDANGQLLLSTAGISLSDGNPNNMQAVLVNSVSSPIYIPVFPSLFNGTTWDRARTAGIGNAVAATGIAASAAYGEYLSTAPAPTTGQYSALQTDYAGSLFVKPIRRSETVSQATTIASSAASTTILAAQAAGIFADISNLIVTVTAAAAISLPFTVTLSDGTQSYIFDMETGALATSPAISVPLNLSFNPPLSATTAATVWTITLSVATVTVHITVNAVLQKAS
jgi:hypothetical protein